MLELFRTLNPKAFRNGFIAMITVIVLVFLGSRNLQNFDAALIAYLFGTVFSVFGITYRYSVWLQRPPTKLYWRRTWQFAFSKSFIAYIGRMFALFIKNIVFQRFIYPRGRNRWVGHFLWQQGV
jgi:uncharacterized membrane protein YfcA